jgi:inorganic pyrophosphatase
MIDNGKNDEKIIAIPFEDPSYNVYRSIEALPTHIFEEMQHFFRVYKQLEGKETAVYEVQGQKIATEIIAKCIENYKNEFGTNESKKADEYTHLYSKSE